MAKNNPPAESMTAEDFRNLDELERRIDEQIVESDKLLGE